MLFIDFTLPISNDALPFPGDCVPYFTADKTVKNDHVQVQTWTFSSHQGTHIDAPAHVFSDGKHLDDYPLSKFIAPVRFMISGLTDDEVEPETYLLTEGLERIKDVFAPGGMVFVYTGWREVAEREGLDYFRNSPAFSTELAEWIVEKKFSMVGMDLPSPDLWGDTSLSCHKILLKNDVLLVENLTNVAGLRQGAGKKLLFHAMPLRVKNAEASPVRAYVTSVD